MYYIEYEFNGGAAMDPQIPEFVLWFNLLTPRSYDFKPLGYFVQFMIISRYRQVIVITIDVSKMDNFALFECNLKPQN